LLKTGFQLKAYSAPSQREKFKAILKSGVEPVKTVEDSESASI